MENKSTGDLLENLKSSNNIGQYFKENKTYLIHETLVQILNRLIEEKGLNKSAVLKRGEINDIYGYQLFSGNRNPSRDKLFCLCSGMQLSLVETQQIFKTAGFAPLYPKNKRDCILILGIEKNLTVCEINEMLFDNQEETLK